MKLLICPQLLLLVFGYITLIDCKESHLFFEPTKEYPDKCFHATTKHAFGFGEEYNPPDSCVRITCGNPAILIESCDDLPPLTDGCEKTDWNLTEMYPKCCPIISCS